MAEQAQLFHYSIVATRPLPVYSELTRLSLSTALDRSLQWSVISYTDTEGVIAVMSLLVADWHAVLP